MRAQASAEKHSAHTMPSQPHPGPTETPWLWARARPKKPLCSDKDIRAPGTHTPMNPHSRTHFLLPISTN